MNAQRGLTGTGPVRHLPGQPSSVGRSRGAGSRQPARSVAVDPGPGGRLALSQLSARVGGSSVSLNCSGADQGGRHVGMVVGADHRGRARVGVWRDAEPSPLTALRQRPDHGWRSCSTRPTAWRRGRWIQAQRAPPTTQRCPARPGGLGCATGVGPMPLGHPEQLVAGKAASFGCTEQRRMGLGGTNQGSRSNAGSAYRRFWLAPLRWR
jgi:hypothetical protein